MNPVEQDVADELAMEGAIELKRKSLESGYLREKMRETMEESLAMTEAELRARQDRRKGRTRPARG